MTTTRLVSVPRRRLPGWLDRFAERHPGLGVEAGPELLALSATDGTRARVIVPFPPLPDSEAPLSTLLDHVATDRRVGVLLARKGGYAVGVFVGEQLVASKVGSSYVQGTTKAGGWSQQRFARRRQNQARQSAERAADVCVSLLLPETSRLDALITGGHRAAVEQVLADRRLAPLRPLVLGAVLPTPDPRLAVLQAFGPQMLAVRIELDDPAGPSALAGTGLAGTGLAGTGLAETGLAETEVRGPVD